MNREILFRGQWVRNGEWVYGHYVYNPISNEHYIFHETMVATTVKPGTVSQYIGLNDVNGNKIFEGDFVEQHYPDYDVNHYYNKHNGLIVNYGYGWKIKDGDIREVYAGFATVKVIGNKWDNPELVEEE